MDTHAEYEQSHFSVEARTTLARLDLNARTRIREALVIAEFACKKLR